LRLLRIVHAWLIRLLLRLARLTLLFGTGLVAHGHLGRGLDVAIGGERLVDSDVGGAAVIGIGELPAIGAGRLLVLHLRSHGRGMLFMESSELGGAGAGLDSTRSAVEADANVDIAHRTAVDVALHAVIDVVDRAVVVEVTAAPVAAFVAEADVAKAVVDAAVVADMPAPVAAIKAVAVIAITPVAGGPKRALIGGLNPRAGNPVIAHGRPGPIAGCPDIVVAGILGLIVVGQWGRRLRGVVDRLLAVTGIVRRIVCVLVGLLGIWVGGMGGRIVLRRGRCGLLVDGGRGVCGRLGGYAAARAGGSRSEIVVGRIGGLACIGYLGRVCIGRSRASMTSDDREYSCRDNQRNESKF